MFKVDCLKCNGKGTLIEYINIQNGKCYQCEGKGYINFTNEEYKKHLEIKDYIEKSHESYLKQCEQQEQEEIQEEKERQQRKEDNIKSFQNKLSYYGSIGDNVTLQLKLNQIKKTRYGYMHCLSDNNHQFTFYSKENYTVMDDQWNITGTIKEYQDYKGYKKTILNKVTVNNQIDFSELTDEQIDQLYDEKYPYL